MTNQTQKQLPDGWREVRLGDVVNIIGGGTPKRNVKEYWNGDIPWLSVKDFNHGYRYVYHADESITDYGLQNSSAKILEKQELIISARGTVGELAQITKPMAFNQSCYGINAKKDSTNNFLYYLIKNSIHFMKSIVHGSIFDTITRDTFNHITVNLPPLPEQKAIAHILGSLDDKIELNCQMNQTLEDMAQALFKSWFVDFDPVIDNAIIAGNPIPEPLQKRAEKRKKSLNNGTASREIANHFPNAFEHLQKMGWIPKGWEVTNFGEVSKCLDNARIPLSKKQRDAKQPKKYPYYGATSINDYINEYIFNGTYLLLGEDGSVLRADNTPFTQYVWGKIWVNNHAHVLQGKNSVTTEHLLIFIRQQNIAPYITGAVQMKLNQKNMNSIPFLFSSCRINNYFSKKLSIIYEKYKTNSNETQTLTQLRDTLLPKLISGKIRIADAQKMVEELKL